MLSRCLGAYLWSWVPFNNTLKHQCVSFFDGVDSLADVIILDVTRCAWVHDLGVGWSCEWTHGHTHTQRQACSHADIHIHTRTKRERNHIIYLVTSLQQKKILVGVSAILALVSMTQINRNITLLVHLHEQNLVQKCCSVTCVCVWWGMQECIGKLKPWSPLEGQKSHSSLWDRGFVLYNTDCAITTLSQVKYMLRVHGYNENWNQMFAIKSYNIS